MPFTTSPPCPKTTRGLPWRAIALAAALGAVWPAARAFGLADPSGASASGYVTGDFKIGCSTCPHYLLDMSGQPSPFDGGAGAATASVEYAGGPLRGDVPTDYTLGGGATLAAHAALLGPWATPLLKARAAADNAPAYIVSDPAHVQIGVDVYQTLATASTVMAYTYTGSGSASYTFNFHVDGTVTTSLASVFASAGFYDAFGERNYSFNSVSVAGSSLLSGAEAFSHDFSVSMNFNAGDTFYLHAKLDALADVTYASADVSANAFDTFTTTSITGGNLALLQPGFAGNVPEPATWAGFGLGLAALAWRRRQRPQH